jgi:hypothetical protein
MAATIPDTRTTPAGTIEYDISALEQRVTDAWAAYQKAEPLGIDFGKACYELRKAYGAQGSRTGKGLAQLLRKLGIKEGKAYYWIAEYKASVGQGIPCPSCTTNSNIRRSNK